MTFHCKLELFSFLLHFYTALNQTPENIFTTWPVVFYLQLFLIALSFSVPGLHIAPSIYPVISKCFIILVGPCMLWLKIKFTLRNGIPGQRFVGVTCTAQVLKLILAPLSYRFVKSILFISVMSSWQFALFARRRAIQKLQGKLLRIKMRQLLRTQEKGNLIIYQWEI